MKLLIVLGEGGHTKQMLNLVNLLMNTDHSKAPSEPGAQNQDYQLHYIISRQDHLSAGHIKHPGPIYRVTRPRGKSTGKLGAALLTLVATVESLWILLRVRPAAIISAGPAIAVPASILGKLLGARVIYLESSSRISRPSVTGRILYRWADLFFVQWEQLQSSYPRALFAGRLV